MYQKLITKEVEREAAHYPLYSQDGKGGDAITWLKFFHPSSRYTLFVTEADLEEGTLSGYVISPLGPDCDEYGYTSLDELKEVKAGPFGLGVERDMHFAPRPLVEALATVGVQL